MARDGRIEVWEGMWLSTFILLPLGIFFTYKAVNDSALFNRDAYTNFFRKLIGRSETRKLEVKEVVMTEVEIPEALSMIDGLIARCNEFMTLYKGRQSYIDYWTQGYNRRELHAISADLEHTVDYISNSRNRIIILKLMELPVMKSLWFYPPHQLQVARMAVRRNVPHRYSFIYRRDTYSGQVERGNTPHNHYMQ